MVSKSFMANSDRKRQAARRSGTKNFRAEQRNGRQRENLRNDAPVTLARSRIMRSIRQTHTKPELIVRKIIHAMGFRFRLHQRELPGKPDIVLRRHGVVVQVNGCFWHQHGCSISNIPSTRTEYWIPKLARNVERDTANNSLLTSMGWRVITVWECEVGDISALSKKLRKSLKRS
jgi:DNA mismatch endonuclease (patch repair protein)